MIASQRTPIKYSCDMKSRNSVWSRRNVHPRFKIYIKKYIMLYVKSSLVITGTISYQFWAYKYGIDTEFYCGSPGMVFGEFVFYNIQINKVIFWKSFFSQNRTFPARKMSCGRGEAAATKTRYIFSRYFLKRYIFLRYTFKRYI